MSKVNIAIDGPAGAGKSTIAKTIAKALEVIYVDTGAMYRAFGLYCMQNDIPLDDKSLDEVVEAIQIGIRYDRGEQQVILNNEVVNTFIRDEEVGKMASKVSAFKQVRLKLVDLQQKLAEKNSVVMDGRDIGTYVLPNADLKIYLTASVDVRAKRRFDQLQSKSMNPDYEAIKEEISKRDYRDMNREFAPLKIADDAIEIDTSALSIHDVVCQILEMIKQL